MISHLSSSYLPPEVSHKSKSVSNFMRVIFCSLSNHLKSYQTFTVVLIAHLIVLVMMISHYLLYNKII